MEEAKDYKNYLKGLKEATSRKGPKNIKLRKIMGIAGSPGIQGLLVGRSAIKKKRGGSTPGLKDYVKKSDAKTNSIGGSDAFKKALEQYKAKAKEYSSGPQKGQMSDREMSEFRDAISKRKRGGLTGGQKKLDKNKDGKITGEDFKMMKKGYGAARKDGMGLQDESIKPGKVMKAGIGAMMLAKKMKDEDKKMPIAGMAVKIKSDAIKKILGRSKGGGADMSTEMSDKRKKKFKEILERLKAPRTINIKPEFKSGTSNPMQRDRKREGYRAKVEKSGGKVMFADEIGMKKFKNFMGGGMMNKPMGYKKGASIMARGCKLGRKKATKLY